MKILLCLAVCFFSCSQPEKKVTADKQMPSQYQLRLKENFKNGRSDTVHVTGILKN